MGNHPCLLGINCFHNNFHLPWKMWQAENMATLYLWQHTSHFLHLLWYINLPKHNKRRISNASWWCGLKTPSLPEGFAPRPCLLVLCDRLASSLWLLHGSRFHYSFSSISLVSSLVAFASDLDMDSPFPCALWLKAGKAHSHPQFQLLRILGEAWDPVISSSSGRGWEDSKSSTFNILSYFSKGSNVCSVDWLIHSTNMSKPYSVSVTEHRDKREHTPAHRVPTVQ